jgi:mono/diheme cytochrome c family protein
MARITSLAIRCLWNLGLFAAFFFVATSLYAQGPSPSLPAGDGRDLVSTVCTECHTLKPILIIRDGSIGWKNRVQDMILQGAQLTPAEADVVTQYLSRNFGPGAQNQQTGPQVNLPNGPGKELVESHCTLCHSLTRVTSAQRSSKEWAATVKNMMSRGVSATPEEIQSMTSYLSTQFGSKSQ